MSISQIEVRRTSAGATHLLRAGVSFAPSRWLAKWWFSWPNQFWYIPITYGIIKNQAKRWNPNGALVGFGVVSPV